MTLAGKTLAVKPAPYPDFIRESVAAGGLVEYARRLPGQARRPSGEREK